MRTPEWIRSQEVDETGRERINWWRVLLLVGGLIVCLVIFINIISSYKGEDEEKVPEKVSSKWKEPTISFDQEAKADESPVSAPSDPAPEEADEHEEKDKEPDPRIEIMARLGQERIASFRMDHKRIAEFQEFAKVSGGVGCDIMPGTIAKVRLDSSLSTDNGGAVTAVLVEPVPGPDGCIALNSGAIFTGVVDTNVNFGQKRANVVFTSITSEGRAINIQAQAGDAMGGGGVPGKVNRHMGSKIAGVAIATAVDLAGFALAGGGSGYSIIVGNAGGVLDDFARQFVNRKDTITVDPSQNGNIITVTFTQQISP